MRRVVSVSMYVYPECIYSVFIVSTRNFTRALACFYINIAAIFLYGRRRAAFWSEGHVTYTSSLASYYQSWRCKSVTWPSGLMRWFKAPVSSEPWVRIPPLPIFVRLIYYILHTHTHTHVCAFSNQQSDNKL
jgi:hypothetical protein